MMSLPGVKSLFFQQPFEHRRHPTTPVLLDKQKAHLEPAAGRAKNLVVGRWTL
jgi:hypothetical protein